MNIENIKIDKNHQCPNRFSLVSNLVFDTKIIYLCITVKNQFTGQFLNLIRIDKWAMHCLNRNRYVWLNIPIYPAYSCISSTHSAIAHLKLLSVYRGKNYFITCQQL